MGNSTPKTKIIVIDELESVQEFYKAVEKIPNLGLKHYFHFDNFIEKENLKKVSNIILREKEVEPVEENKSKTLLDVSPFSKKEEETTKSKLVYHIKKYNLDHLNLYLLVPDLTNFLIPSFERPYVRGTSSDFRFIVDQILKGQSSLSMNIKFKKMVGDLFRKIVVKIIDERFIKEEERKKEMCEEIQNQIKIFKKSDISFEYFRTLVDYEKSTLSTTCEYIICFPNILTALIDSRSSYDHDYNIILRENPDEQKEKKKKRKGLWLVQNNIEVILQRMRRCTTLKAQEKPKLSTNTILCGDDWAYLENFDYIKQKTEEDFKKVDEKKYNSLNIHYCKGVEDFENIMSVLQKSIFSYMVVFESGLFFENMKKMLRKREFSNRVQLTCIPQAKKAKTQEEKVEWKISYFINEVKFKIKSQIAPIQKLYLYRFKASETAFLQNKLGIITQNIESYHELYEYYLPPSYNKYISGLHLVCNIDTYQRQIKRILLDYKDTYFKNIKIIILDQRFAIRPFIEKQSNYSPQIVLIHYNIDKIKEYLSFSQAPIVSIPFFRKHTLTNFEKTAKQIAMMKPSMHMSLKTSVVSTNQLIKQIFKDNVKISVNYQLSFLKFESNSRNTDRDIAFFQDKYLSDYSKLCHVGYNIYKRNQFGDYENFDVLKQEIKACFYKCKIYGLMRVTDEEFQLFYINKINECKSFFDLQIACIYILSLPHGFAEVINNMFNRPRKTKLAMKIFSQFILVIFTSFSLHENPMMEKIELLSYFENDEIGDKLKAVKIGDIMYTSSFVFCCKNQSPEEIKMSNCFIFEFQNIPFLEKSRIKSALDIERFSFYKEGAEYLISPFTQFLVTNINFNDSGKCHITLAATNETSVNTFMHKVLKENQITEENLYETIKNQIQLVEKTFSQSKRKNIEFYDQETSLYRKAERLSFIESKVDLIYSMEKQLIYDEFFFAKNQKLYISAQSALSQKQVQKNVDTGGKNNLKATFFENMLEIERAMLYFKMTRYSLSLSSLLKVQKYLSEEHAMDKESWMMKTIDRFIECVKNTFENRKSILSSAPKTKKWTVKASKSEKGRLSFKLKGKKQRWQVNYVQSVQKFTLTNKKNSEMLIPAEPDNEFGDQVLTWIGNDPYHYLEVKSDEKQSNNIQTITEMLKQEKLSEDHSPPKLPFNIGGAKFGEKNRKKSQADSLPKNEQNQKEKKNEENLYRSTSAMNKKKSQDFIFIIDEKQEKKQEEKKENQYVVKTGENSKQIKEKVLAFIQSQRDIYQGQEEGNYTQKMEWKVFYMDGDVNVLKKGKHFHTKMGIGKKKVHKQSKIKPVETNFILDG